MTQKETTYPFETAAEAESKAKEQILSGLGYEVVEEYPTDMD